MVKSRPTMQLVAGATIHQFALESQIGAGGMGVVWSARDTGSGRAVALKILRLNDPSQADVLRARLLREAHATRRIDHPGIVPVLDVIDHEGNPVLVMDLLCGETLRQLLKREGRLTEARACALLAPIAEALSAAHRAGIVHRDLKPENIFIQQSPETSRVRLLDFGVARFYETPETNPEAPLTGLGALIGTLAYMAPEQALHPSECDHRVDIWALGIILYETLSGCRPIEGSNGPDTMRQLLIGAITPLAVVSPEVSENLTSLVASLLKRAPERRPPDLDGVLASLRRHAELP